VQTWTDPAGSRRMRLPDLMTAHEGDKFVTPTYRPPLPPGYIPEAYFC